MCHPLAIGHCLSRPAVAVVHAVRCNPGGGPRYVGLDKRRVHSASSRQRGAVPRAFPRAGHAAAVLPKSAAPAVANLPMLVFRRPPKRVPASVKRMLSCLCAGMCLGLPLVKGSSADNANQGWEEEHRPHCPIAGRCQAGGHSTSPRTHACSFGHAAVPLMNERVNRAPVVEMVGRVNR